MTHEELTAITVEHLPGSEVKLTGEIPYQYLAKYRAHAIEHVQEGLDLPGFRKGHIPENILIARIGEMPIIQDMAEHAIEHAYPEIVKEHKLDVIGYPKIAITKIAKDNPLGFTITVAVVPPVTLPDYKKLAADINKNKESSEVTAEEIEKQISEILRQKVAYERLQEKAKQKAEANERKKELDGVTELPTPETVSSNDDSEEDPASLPLPELTDDYVKTLGQPGQFATVEDFKAKVKEHLTIQKAEDVAARHRAKLTDAIIEKTVVELPQVLIDAEIGQLFGQMEGDLERAQLKMDDYLTHIKKTRDDLKKDWTPAAEKRAKLQLVLNEIAKLEKITPDAGRVDQEVSNLLERYKDADERRVRTYVESVIANDAVLAMLEAQ